VPVAAAAGEERALAVGTLRAQSRARERIDHALQPVAVDHGHDGLAARVARARDGMDVVGIGQQAILDGVRKAALTFGSLRRANSTRSAGNTASTSPALGMSARALVSERSSSRRASKSFHSKRVAASGRSAAGRKMRSFRISISGAARL
jgi:hypothetical protein